MAPKSKELGWSDLQKMSEEVVASDGPGSKGWNGKGSVTERVNDEVMEELRNNKGKIPGKLESLPLIIITTIGAKSGKRRAIPLAYQIVDNRLLLIASMGGSVRNPPWFHNLVRNSSVEVELNGETFQSEAVVTEGKDRDHLFGKICESMPIFGEYQERTERTIPVIELKRIDG